MSEMETAVDKQWDAIAERTEVANTVREGMIMCDVAWHECDRLMRWLEGHKSRNDLLVNHLSAVLLNLGEQSDNYGQWLSKEEAKIKRAIEALEGGK